MWMEEVCQLVSQHFFLHVYMMTKELILDMILTSVNFVHWIIWSFEQSLIWFIYSSAILSRLLKTTYHKKHGADRICFTHHTSSVVCSSKYNIDSTGGKFN